ncbi:hypothetical protein [Couchioplanes caeruleus]|uniref:Uncharacterized protein n=2 Tax=Couchioplanes caeruleus TaxID=56438 RepID=A0A1K0GB94_9ACTN|nr:hypothetical protein [Couchioplanes caeruleus]OJF14514.1 hypothetical protein BG844_09270 [Couchioplanes caeruleus subsp. caeruleus]ROP21216.1 hypothetical protein EDD30_7610 [Couchioplanes caeruleus]
MSQGTEVDEIMSRASGVVAAVVNASTQLLMALIELRIQRLREAAERDREQVRRVREQTRAYHQADAAVWRAAMRRQWWREAGAEDISRVWRAASTWQHVDPRAAEARQVVVERLAERGVRVDLAAQTTPSSQDVAWLSDALDRAAADRAAQAEATRGHARSGSQRDTGREASAVVDGELGEAQPVRAERRSARDREERAAAHVRAAWSDERAERVISCKAWGALVNQLDQLEEQGHDVEMLLRGVPAFVDQAHTPAAFAFRSIDDRLDGPVDLGTQSRGGGVAEDPVSETAPASRESSASNPGSPGVAADPAAETPDAGAAQVAAGYGEAALLAAQAYPITTQDAVAGAAARSQSGAPCVTAARHELARPGHEQHLDAGTSR